MHGRFHSQVSSSQQVRIGALAGLHRWWWFSATGGTGLRTGSNSVAQWVFVSVLLERPCARSYGVLRNRDQAS